MRVVKLNKKTLAVCLAILACLTVLAAIKKPGGKILETEGDRVNYINSLGYTVAENPEVANIIIPAEFDRVYGTYNELQKKAGMNLEKYKGKTVTMYTYTVTNAPEKEQTVYLHLLIYNSRVIGGDVCSAEINGFMRPLK